MIYIIYIKMFSHKNKFNELYISSDDEEIKIEKIYKKKTFKDELEESPIKKRIVRKIDLNNFFNIYIYKKKNK